VVTLISAHAKKLAVAHVKPAANATVAAVPSAISIEVNGKSHEAFTDAAGKDLPARLLAAEVANLLNCTPEDVAILVTAGKLRPLGRPNPNAMKFFSAFELIALLADRE
jgi:hypothetical protein